jgi:hypothetical protein
MSSLREFLNPRRVKDTTWNLTGMGPDTGKYYVSPEDYSQFIHLFNKDIHINRNHSSLLEKHDIYSPILIDLDFRYPSDLKERAFDKPHIQQFIQEYASAFFHFFDYHTSLRFFVMLRPEITEEKGVVKDGLHIVCGDITTEYSVLHTLRTFTLEKNILRPFADRTNSDKDCFDESVIQRNNWFLYGASKPNHEPYIADYCFLAHPSGSVEEAEWIETDEELIQLFSLQLNRSTPTPISLRPDMEDEWKLWESIANGDKPDTPKKTRAREDIAEKGSICSHVSADICKILRLNGFDWKIDECDEGYKLSHNTKNCIVATGAEHTTLGHSCVFVQRNHAILSCFSHNSKKLPKNKSEALWRLLANEEESDSNAAYTTMKEKFEQKQFRVLNPPGYMTQIDDSWVHYTRQQLIDMNSGLFLDDEKKERFIDWWLRDHTIRTYSKTGYFVDVSECPTTVFNMFTGFAAEKLLASYIPSRCDIILDHIRILCNHNEEAYEFLLDWFAVLLQRPGFLNGICVVFKGKHGCGKDMFLSWFGTRIVGLQNYYKTARPHIDLFGAFNSSRKDIVFYHIEEGNDVVFKDVNLQQFKNYITDSYASIQLKQKNTTTADSLVKNYNHFAISTNHVISCEINERRFFGVEASSEKCKQSAYFTALAAAMDNPDIVASFYYMLQHRDVGGRNWSDLPQTEYMKEMRSAGMPELYHFLQEFVEMQEEECIRIRSSDLYDAYRDWRALHGTEKLRSVTGFGRELKNVKGITKVCDRDAKYYQFYKSLNFHDTV